MKRLVFLHFIIDLRPKCSRSAKLKQAWLCAHLTAFLLTFLHCALCLIPCCLYGQSSFKCRLDSIWVTSTHKHERYVFTYDKQGHLLSEDYEQYIEYRDHISIDSTKICLEYDSFGRPTKADYIRFRYNGDIFRNCLECVYDEQGGWTINESFNNNSLDDLHLLKVHYAELGDKMMTKYMIYVGDGSTSVYKEEYHYADSAMNIPIKMYEYVLEEDSNVWKMKSEHDYKQEKEQENKRRKIQYDSFGNMISFHILNEGTTYNEYDTTTERHQVMGLHYEPNDMMYGYFTHSHLLELSADVHSKIIESKCLYDQYDKEEITTYFYTELHSK